MTPTLLSLNSPSEKDGDVTREATLRQATGSLSASGKEGVRSCVEGRHGVSYPSLCTGETGAGWLSQAAGQGQKEREGREDYAQFWTSERPARLLCSA